MPDLLYEIFSHNNSPTVLLVKLISVTLINDSRQSSYSDCLLSLINVTEISLTNRTVGELLWENISYSKSGISDH